MKKLKEKKYSILSGMSKYSLVFIIVFTLFMPFILLKAANTPTATSSGITVNSGIENPLGNKLNDIPAFIKAIIEIVLVVGVPILALAIIYAGFLYVKAQGNPGELEVAHRALLYTVIGGALLLGAFVIANAIGGTVKEITNGA